MTAPILNVVKAMTVQPAALTSDVPENDHPLWLVGTTYALGDRVTYEYVDGIYIIHTHKIYESVQAGNVGKAPTTEPTWWKEVSPTNRWKMFDLSTSTQTLFTAPRYYQIALFKSISALTFVGVTDLASIRVRLTDVNTSTVVYDQTFVMRDIPSSSSWYSWTFEERLNKQSLTINNIPTYPLAILRIDVTPVGSSGAIGVCMFGLNKTIGTGVHAGAKLGIVDYSRKEKNEYGDTVLVQRAYSSRASYTMHIDNAQLDNTMRLLTDLRATPCTWSIPGSFDSATVFGYYASFDITVQYAQYAVCNIDIEGLA